MAKEPSFLSIAFGLQNKINNKKKLKKTPKWKYPWAVEKLYEAELVRYVNIIEHEVNTLIIPAIPGLKAEYELNKISFDGVDYFVAHRNDEYTANLNSVFDTLKIRLATETPSPVLLATDISQKTNKWNSAQWSSILQSVLGIKGFIRVPGVAQIIKAFINENVNLITNLESETLRKMKLSLNNSIISGQRVETIASNVEHTLDVSRSRARLIARDQIGKLNGQLTMNNQTGYGITHYIWQASNDSRVRQTHLNNNNKRFAWDTPPMSTGHPGQDYQCRCWADPDFSTIGL